MLAHQYALSLFRLIAALTRSIVMAYTLAWLIFLLHMLLGGFLLPKRKLISHCFVTLAASPELPPSVQL